MSGKDYTANRTEQRYQQLRPSYGLELLPVIPADATLSQSSKIPQANLGKIPGRCYDIAANSWGGLIKWPTRATTEAELDRWEKLPEHAVCVRTRYNPAIDIDIDDPEIAARVIEIIDRCMPETATRTRDGSPRVVKSYKLAEGVVADKKTVIELPDGGGVIEILGDGQQVVLAGPHKSGAMQTLSGEPAEITVNQLRTVIAMLRNEMGATIIGMRPAPGGAAGSLTPGVIDAATAALAGDTLTDDTLVDLRSALTVLDANDRGLWTAIGHALRTLPDDAGWPVFAEWSSTAADEFRSSPEKLRDEWEGFAPDRTGYKSVFTKAQATGWVNPKKRDDLFTQEAVFEQDSLFEEEPAKKSSDAPKCGERIPLGDTLRPVKPFDYTMLPDGMEPWIRDSAELMQCPPDLIAAPAMVAAAALIGRKVQIYPKAKDSTWRVVPNLWGANVARPSVMKSPAQALALAPMEPIIAEDAEKFKQAIAQYEVEQMFNANGEKADRARISEALKVGDLDEIIALKDELIAAKAEEPPKPTEVRRRVNDVTVERLQELLNENPDGFLYYRDELTGLLRGLDREEKAEDRAFMLECFNGSGAYTSDRIGRGKTHVESTTLSVFGGMTPSAMQPYIYNALNHGTGDDGLIQRVQLMVYPDTLQEWRHVDRLPDEQARQAVFAQFKHLADMEAVECPVHFTKEAQKVFDIWLELHAQMVKRADIHPAIESHLNKYKSLLPSLALVVNELDAGHGADVTLSSLKKALKWCVYLKSHMHRIYGMAVNSVATGARIIYERRAKLEDEFTVREVGRMHWANLSDTEQVEAAIRELVECGYAYKVEPEKGKKGRPTTKFACYEDE
jgi:hypothetical protein